MESAKESQLPALGNTARDRLTAIGSAVISALPYIGPIVAEVVNQLIPQQRFERIEAFLRQLDGRLSAVDEGVLADKMRRTAKIDILEEGIFQAIRALSEERLQYLADLVAMGITGEQREEEEAKRLLNLIANITDDQIIILARHLRKNLFNEEFYERHSSVLQSRAAYFGFSQDEIDQSTLYEFARQQLVPLGVLRPNFTKPNRNNPQPEIDYNTGMVKASGYRLAPLGRLLLRRIGLASEGDY